MRPADLYHPVLFLYAPRTELSHLKTKTQTLLKSEISSDNKPQPPQKGPIKNELYTHSSERHFHFSYCSLKDY